MDEISCSYFEAGHLLIFKHFGVERDMTLEVFTELFARALWYEEREIYLTAAAIVKALGGGGAE
ncbi:hypothetical protein [Pelotomaculum propionicicum]|uniref:Uncharacterized protein n=1 Tax=Pelotomaculum propionicicum TaxID=258475 RepID=A0A4Y7RK82_9FIRM|nr:hypothetical protein [Pelotomaculum propionicicum]TEB09139.1 hypothetical protein Pmgp_03360 [Pelotomaculum propionicicum]